MPAERAARNLLVLPRLLRRYGVAVEAGRGRLLLEALAAIDLSRRDDVRAACRAALVRHPSELARFDEAFDLFWALLRGARPPLPTIDAPRRARAEGRPAIPAQAIEGKAPPRVARVIRVVASPVEILRRVDFAAMSREERATATEFLQRLRWSPGLRPSRRFREVARGPDIDLRATNRESRRAWGEPVRLMRKAQRPKRRPLVLLCDVSGSMEAYTRLLLVLCHALARGWGRAEAFTFGTRLTRITRELRHRDADAALARVARSVEDWAGGTRIGDALREFNRRWSRRVMSRGPVVLLCTDGWERGDPVVLAAEAARLARAAYRLVWLDPLSATAGYVPDAGGARVLARYADDHLAANTLDGLAAVAALLETAGHGRPIRRQEPASALS